MKFNVPSKAFHSAISAVGKVVNSKNALQILDNFLIELKGDTLTVTAMDVENLMSANIEVLDAQGEGSFCMNARRLIELFKEIPDQGVKVEVDERLNVLISYAGGQYNFVGIPGIEYPKYEQSRDENENQVEFTALAGQFVKGIENTAFAASTDDYSAALTGILFDVKPDSITFVATDSRKLVRYINRERRPGVTAQCIVGPKPASILKNVFNADEEVEVKMTSKSATFKNSKFTFNCRFIVGNFPPYNRVIPKNNNFVLTVDRATMLNSVRRIGLFVDPGYGLEKFNITPDKMTIKSEDNNLMTSAREEIPCSYTGENLIIGFKSSHMTEILNVLKSDDINIYLSDASRPGIFRPTEEDDTSEMLILLVPMTVGKF